MREREKRVRVVLVGAGICVDRGQTRGWTGFSVWAGWAKGREWAVGLFVFILGLVLLISGFGFWLLNHKDQKCN